MQVNNGPGSQGRFVFIDGLRGVAALGVLFHHLFHNSELHAPLARVFPAIAGWAFTQGARGVQVFFVISGFVIAHSLRDTRVSVGSIGRFIARRQLRLDPPYWLCLALAAANLWVAAAFHLGRPAPSARQFIESMFYLQGLLHQPFILPVSWTLCLEVQFYLFYIVLLGAMQRLGGASASSSSLSLRVILGVMAPLVIGSLVLRTAAELHGDDSFYEPPLFIYSWYLFGLGAVIYWCLGHDGLWGWAAALAALVLACGAFLEDGRMIAGAGTALLILITGKRGGLERWLGGRVIQYFGAISYSLYLIHFDVATRVLKIGIHLTGLRSGPAVAWFVVAGLASVAAAILLHHFVERPSMRLASHFKSRATGSRAGHAVPDLAYEAPTVLVSSPVH